ncbi:protein phosphatase 2C domain-containing protein [Cohnella yongneupensis]
MWSGSSEPHLDQPHIERFGAISIGRYGGNIRAGADKNEDGLLVLNSPEGSWEFAMVVDAHTSSESAEQVLRAIADIRHEIEAVLRGGIADTFTGLEAKVDAMFRSQSFLERSQSIRGECSCLIVCRKGRYVWWYSVGDCMLFVLHPDFTAFGQTMLNQRHFYEWIGRENTFNDAVPCYSKGTTRLRPGNNVILMATDGFVEPGIAYIDAIKEWTRIGTPQALEQRMDDFLRHLHEVGTKDSTTLLAWSVTDA